ncbi:MAG: peptide-methionine (S)-S-oxide reductase MsrA [Firmicutes bacterium]|nr:peptide-methionine (S)-S-oxide reductase MsrA [Bacillota bacterium]
MATEAKRETATLAGGCFWCMEAIFADLAGVVRVTSGYTGGHVPNPTYEQVCSHTTGHAEAVQIEYDPEVITYADLLEVFFAVHDPTTPDRQGADVGSQYRSAVFYHDEGQRRQAEEAIARLERDPHWEGERVVTQVVPLTAFYPAEPYHRDYFARHPEAAYCRAVIAPKVAKFRRRFAHRVRTPLAAGPQ